MQQPTACVSQPGKQKKKFSSFFKSLVIELDKDLYGPDNHLVEVSANGTSHSSSHTRVTASLSTQKLHANTLTGTHSL